jgi:hypothetical protein
MAWFVALLIGLVLNVVSYLLQPKPKANQPAESKDLESPTAEAGRPIPVLFGTKTIKGVNVIHFTDKAKEEYEVKI